MKKYLGLITLISLLCCNVTEAQQKQVKRTKKEGYVRIGVGYNMPAAAQRTTFNLPLNGSVAYNNNGLGDYDIKKASFSAGLQGNVALGIMLNKNIGIELNNVVGIAQQKYNATLQYPDNGYAVTEKYIKHAKSMFFIVPSLVLQHGNKIQVYMRAGIVLPVMTRINNQFGYQLYYSTTPQTITGSETIKHNFNAGLSGAIGLKGKLAKGLIGWAELNYLSLTLNTKKAELDEYYINGQNVTSRVSNPTRQYSPTNTNANTTLPTVTYPFSSVGLHLGISLSF